MEDIISRNLKRCLIIFLAGFLTLIPIFSIQKAGAIEETTPTTQGDVLQTSLRVEIQLNNVNKAFADEAINWLNNIDSVLGAAEHLSLIILFLAALATLLILSGTLYANSHCTPDDISRGKPGCVTVPGLPPSGGGTPPPSGGTPNPTPLPPPPVLALPPSTGTGTGTGTSTTTGGTGTSTTTGGTGTSTTTGGTGSIVTFQNPITYDNIYDLITVVANFIFWIAVAITPILVLIGAFYILTAGDNRERLSKGRKYILYAAIGFILAVGAKGVVGIVKGALGI